MLLSPWTLGVEELLVIEVPESQVHSPNLGLLIRDRLKTFGPNTCIAYSGVDMLPKSLPRCVFSSYWLAQPPTFGTKTHIRVVIHWMTLLVGRKTELGHRTLLGLIQFQVSVSSGHYGTIPVVGIVGPTNIEGS